MYFLMSILPYGTSLDYIAIKYNVPPKFKAFFGSRGFRNQKAFWWAMATHVTWRIGYNQRVRDWQQGLSTLQRSTPALVQKPWRVSLVVARVDIQDWNMSRQRHIMWPLNGDAGPVSRVMDVLAAFPELRELELVFELKRYMAWDHWSYPVSLFDDNLKHFWLHSIDGELQLASKIQEGLAGRRRLVNGKWLSPPRITVITRVAGFEDNWCNMQKNRTGTDYLESEREKWEVDTKAEYITPRWKTRGNPSTTIPKGLTRKDVEKVERPEERKVKMTYVEATSDITDFWQNVEGLVRLHRTDGETIVHDAGTQRTSVKYGFETPEDFGRACFNHAVRRHKYKAVSVDDEEGLKLVMREDATASSGSPRGDDDDGW
jgi:hypothetical protein